MTYEISDSEIMMCRKNLVDILFAAKDDMVVFEKCGAIGRVLNEIKARGGSVELPGRNGH